MADDQPGSNSYIETELTRRLEGLENLFKLRCHYLRYAHSSAFG